MNQVILVGDGNKRRVRHAVAELLPWIEKQVTVIAVDLEGNFDLAGASADLVVVFGGDGTLLWAARRLAGNPIPVTGINFGKLGFLTEFAADEAREGLARLFSGKVRISRRMVLEVTSPLTQGQPLFAVNDVVITRGQYPRMIYIEMTLDGVSDLNYAGDGLIISTPTGSTAYSLSSGGPILTPEMEGMVLTPICPQALSTRPLVIPASTHLKVRLVSEEAQAALTVDGQSDLDLRPGDGLEVRAAEHGFLLARDPDRGFLDILTEKLSWGGQAQYQRRFHTSQEES